MSKNHKPNKVIILLTLSDVFTWGPYTIIAALAGLYLATKFGEDVVQYIGIGTSIYFITRAIVQIPIGLITDKIKKDTDEINILLAGVLLMGFSFLLYPLIREPWHYFVLQFIFGVGAALNVTNWRKLFALNIDKGQEGFDYAVYDTVLSIAVTIFSITVGYIANLGDIYFDSVMSISGLLIMISGIWVSLIFTAHQRKSRK